MRVHEPLSVLDAARSRPRAALVEPATPAWPHIAAEGSGVAVLLNCGETGAELLAQFEGTARPAQAPERGRMDLRTYGIGAQILRECGVHRMNLLGSAAPHAQHGRLRPRGRRLRRRRRALNTTRNTHARRRQGRSAASSTARACASASCRRASTKTSPTRWPQACLGRTARRWASPASDIDHVSVPGALEVPVALQALAERGGYDALIALGCIIRGETYHFELVANESGAGVSRVALDYRSRSPTRSSPSRTSKQAVARADRQGPRRGARRGRDGATAGTTCHDRRHQDPSGKPRQSRAGLTSTGARKASAKSTRSRAREFALQALYQHLVGAQRRRRRSTHSRATWPASTRPTRRTTTRCCTAASREAAELDALIAAAARPQDRARSRRSSTRVLWIGVYEFQHCLDVPWRVVLNECIELAKEFGGTDGHKYVNAVLNGLAPQLRASRGRGRPRHAARRGR